MKKIVIVALLGYGMLNAKPQMTNATDADSAGKGIVYGKVLEKKEVMGYDYLKVDQNGTQRWVAIAKAPVNVGDRIGFDTKTVMKNFKSRGLGRTFKEIVFANEVYLPGKPAVAGSMKAVLSNDIASVSESETSAKDFKPKPFYTVEEVHRFRKMLNGKTISVKATVYKVARQIMKRDWVHLGDGTGNEQKLTDDLVFTAQHAGVQAGDHVIATGKIIVDKDFGYGYFYRVMGENAVFKKQ